MFIVLRLQVASFQRINHSGIIMWGFTKPRHIVVCFIFHNGHIFWLEIKDGLLLTILKRFLGFFVQSLCYHFGLQDFDIENHYQIYSQICTTKSFIRSWLSKTMFIFSTKNSVISCKLQVRPSKLEIKFIFASLRKILGNLIFSVGSPFWT